MTPMRQFAFMIKWSTGQNEVYTVEAESKGQAKRKLVQSFRTAQDFDFLGEIVGEIKG